MRFALLLVGLLIAAPAIGAESFTPDQRAAIVQTVREALRADPSILREAIEAMQRDDARREGEAMRAVIRDNHDALYDPADPSVGNPTGDVTIVEFFDTRCPYCRKLEPVMDAMIRADGHIRLIYKDLPVLGPASMVGSKALLAAQRQSDRVADGYVQLREAIMAPGAVQTEDAFVAKAQSIGMDGERLRRDMKDPAIAARLQRNIELSRALRIEGTPGMLIGDRLEMGFIESDALTAAIARARAGG